MIRFLTFNHKWAVIPVWISGGTAIITGDFLLEIEKVLILDPKESLYLKFLLSLY
jgi:hypothetical protein